jgi:hypothetical protein
MKDDLKSYASVQKWMANVNRMYALSDGEWAGRLKTLGEFCRHLGKDPDTIIEEALEEKSQKVDFMRQLRQAAKAASEDARKAHDWQNVVRSFFIHNGARVVVRSYPEGGS